MFIQKKINLNQKR
jgi:hypothetical protein